MPAETAGPPQGQDVRGRSRVDSASRVPKPQETPLRVLPWAEKVGTRWTRLRGGPGHPCHSVCFLSGERRRTSPVHAATHTWSLGQRQPAPGQLPSACTRLRGPTRTEDTLLPEGLLPTGEANTPSGDLFGALTTERAVAGRGGRLPPSGVLRPGGVPARPAPTTPLLTGQQCHRPCPPSPPTHGPETPQPSTNTSILGASCAHSCCQVTPAQQPARRSQPHTISKALRWLCLQKASLGASRPPGRAGCVRPGQALGS